MARALLCSRVRVSSSFSSSLHHSRSFHCSRSNLFGGISFAWTRHQSTFVRSSRCTASRPASICFGGVSNSLSGALSILSQPCSSAWVSRGITTQSEGRTNPPAIRASKFTPEVLLSAPRRSAGVPNSDGSQVLYSTSTYNFTEHAKKSEIRVLDAKSHQTSLITDEQGASEPLWIDDETVLVLSEGENGSTKVKVGPVGKFANR